MSGTREENIFMARLAEQAERYEDMTEYMRRVVGMGQELTLHERNLLSVAYKNSVGSRRMAWRSMGVSEQQNPAAAGVISNYKKTVEDELDKTCDELISVLNEHLIPQASTGEAQAFFIKMKGDYYRYKTEFKTKETGHDAVAGQANEAYAEALRAAEGALGAANPVRLGLALNYSVFFNEVMRDPNAAIQLARKTCKDAEKDLLNLGEDEQRDSTQILQLLQDNLALWSAGVSGEGAAVDGTAVEDL